MNPIKCWAVVGGERLVLRSKMGQMRIFRKSWYKKASVLIDQDDEKVIEVKITPIKKSKKDRP